MKNFGIVAVALFATTSVFAEVGKCPLQDEKTFRVPFGYQVESITKLNANQERITYVHTKDNPFRDIVTSDRIITRDDKGRIIRIEASEDLTDAHKNFLVSKHKDILKHDHYVQTGNKSAEGIDSLFSDFNLDSGAFNTGVMTELNWINGGCYISSMSRKIYDPVLDKEIYKEDFKVSKCDEVLKVYNEYEKKVKAYNNLKAQLDAQVAKIKGSSSKKSIGIGNEMSEGSRDDLHELEEYRLMCKIFSPAKATKPSQSKSGKVKSGKSSGDNSSNQ